MTASLASTDTRDITLSIDAGPAGMPLSMAGYLLRAVGTAYPNTMIDARGTSGLHLRIPYTDIVDVTLDGDDLADLVPDPEDPATIAFTHGIVHGGAGATPPPWLSAMLLSMAAAIDDSLAADNVPNYLAVDIHPSDGSVPFTWIVCRPGRRSPLEMLRDARDRITSLETQLREHNIEPR